MGLRTMGFYPVLGLERSERNGYKNMGDDILKGSIDFNLALESLGKMNDKIKEALELVNEIHSHFFGNEDENKKRKEKLKKLLKEIEDLKKDALKALVLKGLYDEMCALDELIEDARRFLDDNYNDRDDPEKKKKAREGFVVLLKKVKAKKESIEKKLPKVPDNKMDWLYIMNRYLKPYVEGRITEGTLTEYRLIKIIHRIRRYKKYAIRYLPSNLCGKRLDWWYRSFKRINNDLKNLERNLDSSHASSFDRKRIIWLKAMEGYKKDMEKKIRKYMKES